MAGQDWWKGAVTYQVYPRSFQDTNGDGIGDLPGITARLPHIADLGVDAIWLSPIFTSPMRDMGYDVSDYTDIDPTFGTLQDFDALIQRAHDLGLKIIIDQVLSHCSDQHPFFTESRASRDNPRADWFVWADPRKDGTPPTNWLSVFGGSAWTWDARRKQYYLHNFLSEQPDFNFHNPAVQDWHLANMRFWLDRGVDGFRFDTANYFFHDPQFRDNPADFREKTRPDGNPYEMQYHLFDKNRPETTGWMERIRSLLDSYDSRASVGEVGDSHHAIRLMGEYTGPSRLHQCYSFEMMGPDYAPAAFRRKIEDFFAGAPNGWPMWAFSNHDVPRHVSRWSRHGTSQDAIAKQAAALILSFEGSICLWQGEELGQTDTDLAFHELTDPQGIAFWPEPVGRDNTRTPMVWDGTAHGGFTSGTPWLPVKPPQLARNAAAQAQDPESVLNFYKLMLRYRRERSELRTARTRFLDLPDPVLGFTRGDGLVCVFNLSPAETIIRINGLAALTGPSLAATLDGDALTLGPNGVAFATTSGVVEAR